MSSMALEITPPDRAAQVKKLACCDAPVDVALLLRAAVEGVGCPHEAAAKRVGYQPDYWNRVLGNERGITLGRLGRLPVDVQADLVTRWADALGLTIERRGGDGLGELRDLSRLLAEKRVKISIEKIG